MHPSILPLERTLDMNTRLFLNCLDGVLCQNSAA